MNNETKFKVAKSRLLGTIDANIARMLTLAAALGVDRAEVSFDGSGDDGTVNAPELYTEDRAIGGIWWNQVAGKYEDNPAWAPDHEELSGLVREYAGKIIDGAQYDWYNNEGGGGSVTINLAEGTSSMSLYQNEVIRTNEEHHKQNMLGEEEGEVD